MKAKIVLGIDLGTSAVKILAVNQKGEVIDSQEKEYEIIRDGVKVEQKPEDWWQAVKKGIKDLEIDKNRVKGIGMSGQLNGLVLVDKKGNPLRNAIIWLDRRASKQARYLNKEYGDLIKDYSFSQAGPIYNLSKLQWLKENEKETLKNTYKILFAKDYITYKLTDEFVTDVSDAGAALMLDLEKRDWANEILEKIIDLDKLPELHESVDLIGSLTSEMAEKLGLKEGIPVVAGAGDMAALSLGTGVVRENKACATIGTAGHVAAYLPQLPKKCDDRVWVMAHAIPGKYFWHGLVMTGGYSLKWFLENLGQLEKEKAGDQSPYQLLMEGLEDVTPGSNGLIYLPFLDGAATPYQNPEARAGFIGLTSNHSKKEMIRAVLEGVAYNFRDSFEIIDPDQEIKEIMVGEGGSKNLIWPQIMADVMGRDARLLSELNSSALGASMLAGVGSEVWSDFEEADQKLIKSKQSIKYSQKNHQFYNKSYQIYQKIYNSLEDSFQELAELENKGGSLDD
ncbi:MAG TPA: xylulokinase [Halanaerobiales bacterium]|nr:xylulokinase [Halanaerobiales bacterium]